ncbi:MAG: hypothetical protein J1E32_05865, partial [Treponema sp.]|nr:hypothetical protein [Treponema sp.]
MRKSFFCAANAGTIKKEQTMIVVLKNGAPQQRVDELKAGLKARGLDVHESKGAD